MRMLVHKLGNNFAGNVEALAIAPLCVCVLMIANVSAFLVIMLEECSKIYSMWVFFAFLVQLLCIFTLNLKTEFAESCIISCDLFCYFTS